MEQASVDIQDPTHPRTHTRFLHDTRDQSAANRDAALASPAHERHATKTWPDTRRQQLSSQRHVSKGMQCIHVGNYTRIHTYTHTHTHT